MKKTTKILALVLVVAMLGCMLMACGKTLKGTYAAEALTVRTAYVFDGKKVSVEAGALGFSKVVAEGTYKIEDGKITFTFGEEGDKYAGSFDFEEGENSIKIAGVTYTKE